MIKTKVAVLEARLLSSQSEQSEKFSKSLIAGKKPALQKSHFCFNHEYRLLSYLTFTDLRNFSTFSLACLFYFTVHRCTKLFGPKVE